MPCRTCDIFCSEGKWNSSQNGSCNSTIALGQPVFSGGLAFTFTTSIILSAQISLSYVSIVLNYYMLKALVRVKQTNLKVRGLIQTCAIINIILQVLISVPVSVIARIVNITHSVAVGCVVATKSTLYSILVMAQTMSTLGLACDRLYAVAKPLTYHTIGYNIQSRIIMIISPLIVSLLITGIYVLRSLESGLNIPPDHISICVALSVTLKLQASSRLTELFLLFGNILSLCVYWVIFLVLRCQRAKMKRITDSVTSRQRLVLTLTYFLTNVSTLLLYVPYPLFALVSGFRELDQGSLDHVTSGEILVTFRTVYQVNFSLFPLILSYRIPKIRQNLPFDLNFCGKIGH